MYTIRQAAARTGVSVPLLRAWERPYQVGRPGSRAGAVERDVLPALVDLGEAWDTGRLDLAAEHVAAVASAIG
jgi:hypothetical protein